jgi:Mce-associated membrane protein
MIARFARWVRAEREQRTAESDVDPSYPAIGGEVENTSPTALLDENGGDVERFSWTRVVTYAVLPVIALMLAAAAAWIKWQDSTARMAVPAGVEAVQVASDSAVAMLSYRPDTVEKDLAGVQDRLTGSFRETYTKLIRDVVIPAAKEKQIAAVANVPAAAVVSASNDHAIVLLSVDQTVTLGNGTPSGATSSVRVTLDKIGSRWLVSDFTPV